MKKMIVIIIALLIIVGVILFINNKKTEDKPNVPESDENNLIALDNKINIKSLNEYSIKDTNDSFKVTKSVKWVFPDLSAGETVSFEILIPYIIKENGTEYTGVYFLGDQERNEIDEACSYDLIVKNLDKEGNITIIINKR